MKKLSSLVAYGVPTLFSIGLFVPAYGQTSNNEYRGTDFVAEEGSTNQTALQDVQLNPGTVFADGSHTPDTANGKPSKIPAESKVTTHITGRRYYPQPPEQEATASSVVKQTFNWYSTRGIAAPTFTANIEGHYRGLLKADQNNSLFVVEVEYDMNGKGAIASFSLQGNQNPYTIPSSKFTAPVTDDNGNSTFMDGATLRHTASVRSHCKINILHTDEDGIINAESGLNVIQPEKFLLDYITVADDTTPVTLPGGGRPR